MISHHRRTALIPLKIYLKVEQWTGSSVVKHPNRTILNSLISQEKSRIDDIIYELHRKGKEISFDELIELLRNGSKGKPKYYVAEYFRNFCKNCRKPKTAATYLGALNKMREFLGEDGVENLKFDDISREWLMRFQKFMLTTCCLNTCNIHFRSLRAVINDAINNDITTNYPFRKFKMTTVVTAKRSLEVEELRELFYYPCEPEQEKSRDMFKLIFMLIGINCIDLFNLETIKKDRIEYTRSKTYRLYSIKVEPEALEIINRYRGKKKLLDMADRYQNHVDYLKRLNRELREIGPIERGNKDKKSHSPLFPELSTYWARHTWATIAASLDIPKETIAAALGHGSQTVTDIYIDFDRRKVDEANRRVLDWVLYGRR